MCQTAIEIVTTFEDTDATFDPGMPVASLHEPGFVLPLQTSVGTMTTFWQDDVLHTPVGEIPMIVLSVYRTRDCSRLKYAGALTDQLYYGTILL